MKIFLLLLFTACMLTPVSATLAEDKQETNESPALFAEVLQYAQLSSAAYETKDSVGRIAKDTSNELTMYENLPDLGVTYFLITDTAKKTHWIAIRGTVNVMNTLVNLDIQLTPNNDLGIQLHSGFAETAKSIFQKITPMLEKHYKINIAGHSLGGAVAIVLAMYLDINSYPVARIITFGQPKVTNITGAQKFAHLDILRVVAARDYIPLLPPVDATDITNVNIYWPLGQEIILLDNKEYSVAKGLNSMLRATKFFTRQPDMQNLQEHKIAFYLQSVRDRQQGARWVPYKNDFSMFSIFTDRQ